MSAAKETPCRKFQANFFNKSKCQNCFKPRELHLLTDQDLTQVSPKPFLKALEGLENGGLLLESCIIFK